ncbi:MAG: XisH family protein [Acinetobacter sp.]|nr:XisH family protein [Acinetobacter sp.]
MGKDIFHDAVKAALEKEGWLITHDPYTINIPEFRPRQEIDLGAEKMIAAQKDIEKIAVEVKSFVQPSIVYDFHAALGQYLNYLLGLKRQEPERVLYLAVPIRAQVLFEEMGLIIESIETYGVKMIVYEERTQTIVSWKK